MMRPQIIRSLSVHLRETDDHSRLPFHPSCPICRRDRLAGPLDGDELASRRTRAAIAAGLLALSTGGVPAAVASPPDEIIEGTAEVGVGGDPDASVELDPGGEELQLPDEVPATPDTSAPSADLDDDGGPLDQEPATEVLEPVLEGNGHPSEPVADPVPSPEAEALAPAPAETPETSTAPAATEPQKPRTEAGPKPEGGHRREARTEHAIEAPTQSRTAEPPQAAGPAPAAAEPAPFAAPAPVAEPAPAVTEPASAESAVATREVAHNAAARAASGGRFHTVRPGESLWSIAADLLGDGATVPRIAREVNRLWELNDERIGTGRPDLLFAGTRLRLR